MLVILAVAAKMPALQILALLIGWMNFVGAFRETPLQSKSRLANHA